MSKPVILITGANTGIGYETVKALASSDKSHTILLGTRSLDKGQAALQTLKQETPNTTSDIEPLQIDIDNDDSIQAAFDAVKGKYGRVDVLINNAGGTFDRVMSEKPGPAGIREAWQKTYSLNVTSTQVFTYTFIPLLLASSSPRLLFITSGLSSLANCAPSLAAGSASDEPAGWPKPPKPNVVSYRCSKTALNMMMLDWVRVLKSDGVKVFAISPGFLATNLGGIGPENLKKYGAGDPAIGGQIIKDVAEGKRDEDAGKVVNKDGVQPW